MIYTYVLRSKKDGKWYTGFTHNLQERFKQHNNSEVFSTKGRGPFELIYYEACDSEYDAIMREKYLKTGMGKRYLKNRLKRSLSLTGFTLVEILVVIAIIAILASIVLYSATQYINKGRDATIKGNLVVLVTAGELWYDRNSSSYATFCDSDAVKKALNEILSTNKWCNKRIVNGVGTAWAACAKLFVDSNKAYCVDNKGNQKEINNTNCTVSITNCCLSPFTNCVQ